MILTSCDAMRYSVSDRVERIKDGLERRKGRRWCASTEKEAVRFRGTLFEPAHAFLPEVLTSIYGMCPFIAVNEMWHARRAGGRVRMTVSQKCGIVCGLRRLGVRRVGTSSRDGEAASYLRIHEHVNVRACFNELEQGFWRRDSGFPN